MCLLKFGTQIKGDNSYHEVLWDLSQNKETLKQIDKFEYFIFVPEMLFQFQGSRIRARKWRVFCQANKL